MDSHDEVDKSYTEEEDSEERIGGEVRISQFSTIFIKEEVHDSSKESFEDLEPASAKESTGEVIEEQVERQDTKDGTTAVEELRIYAQESIGRDDLIDSGSRADKQYSSEVSRIRAGQCLANESRANKQVSGVTTDTGNRCVGTCVAAETSVYCELCNYKNLMTHIRTHTDENPFSCELCAYIARPGPPLMLQSCICSETFT